MLLCLKAIARQLHRKWVSLTPTRRKIEKIHKHQNKTNSNMGTIINSLDNLDFTILCTCGIFLIGAIVAYISNKLEDKL